VDDVHLADDASIAVIHQLLRRTREQPVMVVLTARPIELDRSPSARRLRENAPSLGISAVEVPPMTEDESRELLAALVEGAAVTPTLAEQRTLLGAAGGFPMVLELLVREWLAEGRDALALTFSAMTTDPAQGSRAEHAYRALIERLIQELPPEIRNVLNLAAILGNRLNDLEMYGLVDLTLARTMTGMTALADLRLLRDNGKELGFRNELIRAQAYMNLPSTLRRALHSRVADRLIAGQTDRPVTGLELAWHCFRGGRPEEGRDYLITGAREAIDGGAVCEAELALRSAIESLSGRRRILASLLLAESLNDQARWGESLAMLSSVETLESTEHANHLFILRATAEWHCGTSNPNESGEKLRAFSELVMNEPRVDLCIAAIRAATAILADDFDAQRAHNLLLRCREISKRNATKTQVALLAVEEMTLAHFSGLESESQRIELLVAEALEHGWLHLGSAAAVAVNMCLGSRRLSDGDYEGGLVYFSRAFEAGINLGNKKTLARSAGNLALCYDRLGDFDKSLHWAKIGLESAYEWQDASRFKLIQLMAWAYAMKGETSSALKALNTDKAEGMTFKPAWARQASLILTSDVLWVLGRRSDAIECAIEATTGPFSRPLNRFYAGPFCRALARSGAKRGEEQDHLERIESIALSAGRLDAIDEADIVSSRLVLRIRLGRELGDLPHVLARSLECLPKAVVGRLAKLGFGQALECAAGSPQ
jgi:tetratricopeptide (TPR) repeat protein